MESLGEESNVCNVSNVSIQEGQMRHVADDCTSMTFAVRGSSSSVVVFRHWTAKKKSSRTLFWRWGTTRDRSMGKLAKKSVDHLQPMYRT